MQNTESSFGGVSGRNPGRVVGVYGNARFHMPRGRVSTRTLFETAMSSTAASILGKVPRERLDSRVSDIHLAQIARDLKKWEGLVPLLGLTEAQEEEVRSTFRDYGDQKREALLKWRQMKGNEATYRQLIIALCCVQNIELADKVATLLIPQEASKEPSVGVWQSFREYLIDCCGAARHPSHEQWPMLNMSNYVELTMLEVISTEEGKQRKAKEVRLSEIFISSHKASRKVVLIEGPPGSGKTTLTWHISQQWAEGKLFEQFSLLIPISLANADPTVLNATSLADIIPHEIKETRENVAKAIAERNGKGVCFLIDSWDEAPATFFLNQQSYLFQLIKGGLGRKNLPRCSIVITSRPVASGMFLRFATSHICIAGFNSLKIEEFIDASLSSDTAQENLLQTLQERPQLYALCHLPLNVNIVVHLFTTSRQNLPSTYTELYTALVCSQLIRHRSLRMPDGNELDEIGDISSLPGTMLEKFKAICKLAYNGLKAHQSSFDIKAIRECGLMSPSDSAPDTLSLMMAHKRIAAFGIRHRYSFLHYTLWEYLAAYHIAQLDYKQQEKAVKELLETLPLSMILPFYAGLTKLKNKEVFKLLLEVMKQPLDHVSIAQHVRKHVNEPGSDPRCLLLALLNSVYESGDVDLCNHIYPQVIHNKLGMQLSFDGLHLSPTDCFSIGYYLRHTAIKGVLTPSLILCNISDVGFKMLMCQMIWGQNNTMFNIELNFNPLSHRALECIREGLGDRCLHIQLTGCFHPLISNMFTSLKYLIEGISRSPNCIGIVLGSNYITAEHKYYLVLLIKCLKELLLCNNDLRGAMPLLCAALSHSSVEHLDVSNCCLGDEDLDHLAKVFYNNTRIKCLCISDNCFSSDTFTNFLSVFRNSSSLVFLHYRKQLTETQRRILDEINDKRTKYRQQCMYVGSLDYVDKYTEEWMKNVFLPPNGQKGSNT